MPSRPGVSSPTRLRPLVAGQVGRLAQGEGHEDLPQVVAVGQAGEAARPGAPAEGVGGAQGHVLLVGRPARGASEALAGQPDQAAEGALPDPLQGLPVAGLQLLKVAGDRSFVGHEGRRR
jgi:hypothetical protein